MFPLHFLPVLLFLAAAGIAFWFFPKLRTLVGFLFFLMIAIVAGVLFLPKYAPAAQGGIRYWQGEWNYWHNNDKQAESDYQQALGTYPNPADIYIRLGEIDLRHHHVEAAVNHFQNALDQDPYSKPALLALSKLEWDLGHHQIALTDELEAFKIDPNDLQLNRALVDRYLAIAKNSQNPDDYEQASKLLQYLIQKSPDDDASRYKLAQIFYFQEKYDKALPLYCDLAVKNPDSPETFYSLSLVFLKNKAYHEATQAMGRATELITYTHPQLSESWAAQDIHFRQIEMNETEAPPPKVVMDCVEKLNFPLAAKKEDDKSKMSPKP